MWKIIGLLLILWELLADWLEPLIKSKFGKMGLSVYGVVLLYGRLRERAQGRIMEARVRALEEGTTWNGDTRKSCGQVRMNFNKLSSLSRKGIDRVKRRRRRKVKLDKVWLVAVIAFIGGWVSKQFNIPLPDGYADLAADTVIIVSGLVASWRTKFTVIKPSHPFENGGVESQKAIGDHGPMV